MADPGVTSITLTHGSKTYHVYGAQAGVEGVFLAQGQVDGIYDCPVKVTDKAGAFQEGSTRKAAKKLHRDMQLGFHIIDTEDLYELNDSEFRRIFQYELDRWEATPTVTSLNVTTTLSGTRSIDVLLYEAPHFAPDVDPLLQQYGNLILPLRANDPLWYSTTAMTYWQGSGSGSVSVSNPTPNPMYHEWVLTPGTWSVPDRSWVGSPGSRTIGGAYSTRNIAVTVESADGVARISLDRQKLMIRDSADNNILARLGGQVFAFEIPPYTPATNLPVSVSGSGRIELYQPRRWGRPWGEEIPPGS